jgi:thiol:disulfide interchange protein DsbG
MKTHYHPFKRLAAMLASSLALTLTLAACNKADDGAPSTSSNKAEALPDVQKALEQVSQARGFTVGPMMAAQVVYVLFDPQCPHCGHLWEASKPLQSRVKFVWIPVAIVNGNSTLQAGALLAAKQPEQAMNIHETALLAGKGGMPVTENIAPDIMAAVKDNTATFTALKLESVPFVVAKNAQTGAAVQRSGAMDTAALAQLIGL